MTKPQGVPKLDNDSEFKPCVTMGVVRAELPDGDVVISSADQTRAVVVNGVGAAVLELCDGSRRVGDIARFIAETMADRQVPALERVQHDVSAVVRELLEAGLLQQDS